MDYSRPAMFFIVGAVLASVLFLFGGDRFMPCWLRPCVPVSVVLVPSQQSASTPCPENYYVSNRTHRLVLLNIYYSPPPPVQQSQFDPPPDPEYRTADLSGMGRNMIPDSAEPELHPEADSYPDYENYGGSSPWYGDSGSSGYDSGSYYQGSQDTGYSGSGYGSEQGSSYSEGDMFGGNPAPPPGSGYPPSGSYSGSGAPPPPPAQPLPTTPAYDGAQYGPPPPNSSGYGYGGGGGYGYNGGNGYNGGYGNGYGPDNGGYGNNYGPPPIEIRSGEGYYATSSSQSGPNGPAPNCDQSSNTVTVQLGE